jgi:hypothetical protein
MLWFYATVLRVIIRGVGRYEDICGSHVMKNFEVGSVLQFKN